ncbi:MAG: type II toxin-antitoxin system RelE/ParE family toxin [Candidatus Aminicenantes bacterium]|nr:type II toxin-antitoxin system RelE/ParE family toxin [Candidatus Aminicenantes bacterium]
MDFYKVLFHPKAKKELDQLDGSVRKVVLKQVAKLRETPRLGEKLGNKAGLDLTGYRKMYAYKKKIRIVYRIFEGELLVFVIAVGDREEMAVYRDAFKRRKEKGSGSH